MTRPPDAPHGVDRRRLLSWAAAGVGGLTLGAALTGCGTGGATAIPETAATGDAAPDRRIRIARPAAAENETLDPASSLSAYEYLGALYNRLVRLDEQGVAQPDLAEEWSSSADGTRWTFRLRSGVRFHDGRTLTARDAVYTIQHILDPDTGSPQASVLSTVLDASGVSAPDELTLVCDLTSPNAEFPSLLTAYQCYVIPEGSAADIGRTGIGTGPFRLSSYAPAGRGSVEAFDDHWAGPPALAGIDFYSVTDTQARVNALLAGQIDLISQTNLDFATAQVVAASPRATVARVVNGQWYTIPMLYTSPEFADVRVRQAMKLAYDPQRVIDVAIQGTGIPGHDNPVTPNDLAYTDHSNARDPERARSLLRSAGYDRFPIDLYTSTYDSIFTPMALAYRSSVAEAGIDVTIRNASADSYYTQVWMQQPLCVSYWFTGRPVDQLLNQIFRTGSSYNESAWSDPRYDELLDAARAEMNDERRRGLYQDAQRLIIDDGATMTPMFADRLVGISRDVVNYREYGFELDYRALGMR